MAEDWIKQAVEEGKQARKEREKAEEKERKALLEAHADFVATVDGAIDNTIRPTFEQVVKAGEESGDFDASYEIGDWDDLERELELTVRGSRECSVRFLANATLAIVEVDAPWARSKGITLGPDVIDLFGDEGALRKLVEALLRTALG